MAVVEVCPTLATIAGRLCFPGSGTVRVVPHVSQDTACAYHCLCHAQLLADTPVLLLPDIKGLLEQFVVVAGLENFVMGTNKYLFLSIFETLQMV